MILKDSIESFDKELKEAEFDKVRFISKELNLRDVMQLESWRVGHPVIGQAMHEILNQTVKRKLKLPPACNIALQRNY